VLLARLFAWLDRTLRGVEVGSGLVSPAAASLPPMLRCPPPPRESRAACALLSVDGGGQVLLCGGERLTLGHLRAGRADLLFLADVGAVHATLVRADSLQAGPGWRVEPCARERVLVAEAPVPPEGLRLVPGERVRLGENLEFLLALPDPASASAVLELQHGVECAGARHIVLLAPGAGGRVRIGAAPTHHVRVPGLELVLELEWRGSELELKGQARLDGAPRGALPFPPSERIALTCGRAQGGRPPFALSLEPVPRA
jgi:hypothetical protein